MAALVATISSAVAWAENPPLLETARYQNAEAVELLLASGADPDTRQTMVRRHCIGRRIKKMPTC
jgi:ankyrin repeat protein